MRLSWLGFFFSPFSFSTFSVGCQTKLAGPEATPLADLLWSFPTGCCGVSTLCSACEHKRASAVAWPQRVNIVGGIGSPKPFYAPTCLLFLTGLKHSLFFPLKCLASDFFSNQYCSFLMCTFHLHY